MPALLFMLRNEVGRRLYLSNQIHLANKQIKADLINHGFDPLLPMVYKCFNY